MLNTVRNIISSDATTQEMIAPVIDTLVATKAWSVGEEFIYAGTLYKVTTAIAVGDTIVLGSGGNADTASTVSEEAYRINDATETDIADGDYFPFFDTSASKKKRSLWSNIKAKLKTYFDTLYLAKVTLATVATTGAYADLTGEPTNQSASSGSTTVSLCTRGEKYTWNNKSDVKTSSAATSGGTTLSLCTTGEKYKWNQTLKTSTSSFKAIDPKGATTSTTYLGGTLDAQVHAKINSITANATTMHYLSNGGPVYGAIITKVSNSYYSGLVWGYHADSTGDAPYLFGYRNGTYFIRPLSVI